MDLDLHALETSFDLVAPRGEELMDEFYARLFEAAPAVRPLFAATDLQRQKTMLLSTLVLVRKSLHDLATIVPNLRKLGRPSCRVRGAAGALPGCRTGADFSDGGGRRPRMVIPV